ncbi:MAG: hypothetical protein ACT4RN_15380 [Pseudonocardia sp.]
MPVLPVQVGPIGSIRTWDVAQRQVIDYRNRDARQAIRLVAAAIAMQLERRPVPVPAPAEPDAPYGCLRGHRGRLELDDLDRREQGDILLELRERLDRETDPGVRADLIQMLRDLGDRPDAVRIVVNDVAELVVRYEAGQLSGGR